MGVTTHSQFQEALVRAGFTPEEAEDLITRRDRGWHRVLASHQELLDAIMILFRQQVERRGIQGLSPFCLADFLQNVRIDVARWGEEGSPPGSTDGDDDGDDPGQGGMEEGTDQEGREATPPHLVEYSPSPSPEVSVEILECPESDPLDLPPEDASVSLSDPLPQLSLDPSGSTLDVEDIPVEEGFLVPPSLPIVLDSSGEGFPAGAPLAHSTPVRESDLSQEDEVFVSAEEELGDSLSPEEFPLEETGSFCVGDDPEEMEGDQVMEEEEEEEKEEEDRPGASVPFPVLLVRPIRPGDTVQLPGGEGDQFIVCKGKTKHILLLFCGPRCTSGL
jgi:hypothetical protein